DHLADAYELLGVTDSSSAQEIKRAYRKLMNEHHPDKLMAKGLPPEMMNMAKEKSQQIQSAYELIRKQRDIK
ncbi:MAG: DnaJ domain-containing protein, partial [Vibrio sp.]